jgi:hypothetical protein
LKLIEAVARQAPGIVEVWGRGGGTRESDVARLIAAVLTTQPRISTARAERAGDSENDWGWLIQRGGDRGGGKGKGWRVEPSNVGSWETAVSRGGGSGVVRGGGGSKDRS